MTDNVLPAWFQNLLTKYESAVAHAFILHLNISDLVEGTAYLQSYLGQAFANQDLVIFYDIANGIQFAHPSMKADFIAALDLAPTATSPAVPAGNAMAALMGQPQQQPNGQPAPVDLPTSPADALPLLERLLKADCKPKAVTLTAEEKKTHPYKAAVVIFNAEAIVPSADMAMLSPADRAVLVRLASWGNDPKLAATANPIIFVTSNLADIHPSIRAASSKFEAIAIPLPGYDQRLRFINRWIEADGITDLELSPQAFASASAGLGFVHIEDIMLRAADACKLTPELVKERKEDIIRSEYGEVLEFVEPSYGWEAIGGLEHIKAFMERSIIKPISEGRWRRVPMGVLMTGPAGTGKSAVAVAVARESGINCVRLQIGGKIASKWQGEGERNLDKALQAIDSLAPTIVFIDEIDQVVQRGGGGSGNQQESRIFQRMLEFMSDTTHRGRVVFMAATNRPDRMDAALRRPGRFDKKIPFLIPDPIEREAIFQVMCRRYDVPANEIPETAIALTEGWTGAEIEAAVVKAFELIEDEGHAPEQAITYAVQRLRPSTADIEFMTRLALQEVNDRDLLPEAYWDAWETAKTDIEDDAQEQPQDVPQRRLPRSL